MEEIGLMLISRIQARTSEGVDVNNQPFVPYSPRYALFRGKTGRTTQKVNLFFTGSMMGSMTETATKNQVTLFFMDTEDPSGGSNPKKAYFLNQERRFFALSPDDRAKAMQLIDRHIGRQMRRR